MQRAKKKKKKSGLLEAFLHHNTKPGAWLFYSPVSFSAGEPLAPTGPMGKVTFCKRCQDFYLMAKILCRQTGASVHILSVPHVQTLWVFISLSFSHTDSHARALTHTGGCFLIIHTEKCPVRTSLSCKPDSAGCSVITTPAVHHPISQTLCCVWACVFVWVCVCEYVCFFFPPSLRSETTKHRMHLFS